MLVTSTRTQNCAAGYSSRTHPEDKVRLLNLCHVEKGKKSTLCIVLENMRQGSFIFLEAASIQHQTKYTIWGEKKK